jgi:hypothetical protein
VGGLALCIEMAMLVNYQEQKKAQKDAQVRPI